MDRAPFFVSGEQITLKKNGVWIADGIEITHDQTIALFGRSLFRDDAGYELRVGRERMKITVEDTAYFVTRIAPDGTLSLSDGTREALKPDTLAYRPGRLTCLVHHGQDEAKFLPIPYMDLLSDLREDAIGYYLNFGSLRVDLASHTHEETKK